MNRTIPALSTVSALAVLGLTVAAAPTAAAAPAVASAPTCGPSVRMINRLNIVCVTVDGPSVRAYGVSTQLAPGSGRSFIYKVSATVLGGESLGTESGSAYLGSGTAYIGGPSGVVPCGSTVRASFSLTDFGTPPPTSVVDVVVTC
ncbi:hypothetical protein EH183_41315 [Streptomyces sp. CB01881]|uniref:hypothetical protein n=1 Tax=Streptomyces sp. CB01881 TaxID=2078691 RepID=UPI0011DFF733|nr:hypothetical protein [Streptomyces sp. CB01881]TYC66654.1 hypothetical protein EH183_41315 [Streptomyces sp. CB01881]